MDYGKKAMLIYAVANGREYIVSGGQQHSTCDRNLPALDDFTAVSEPRPLALAS